MLTGVLSCVVYMLGMTYKHRFKGTVYESPSGAYRLRASKSGELPFGMDRVVLILLLSHARTDAEELYFRYKEMSDWCGKKWRPREWRERLARLLDCEIERQTEYGWRPYRIVEWYELRDHGVAIRFARDFQRSARAGCEFPCEHLHRLGTRMGALDIYAFECWQVHMGQFCEFWDPYDEMRASGKSWSVAAALRQRKRQILAVYPDDPFVTEGRFLSCAHKDYWRIAHDVDVDAVKADILAEIAGLNPEEFRAYVARQPQRRRAMLTAIYMEECLAREIIDRVSMPPPAMPEVAQVAVEFAAGADEASQLLEAGLTGQAVSRDGDAEAGGDAEADGDAGAGGDADNGGLPLESRLQRFTAHVRERAAKLPGANLVMQRLKEPSRTPDHRPGVTRQALNRVAQFVGAHAARLPGAHLVEPTTLRQLPEMVRTLFNSS